MDYAVLFPGQGSQSVGMLASLDSPLIAQTLEEASDVLGWALQALVTDGPADELNRTERTQPALLAADIAVWRVLQQSPLPPPAMLAGHSLGEYAALVAAGSLTFADALRLVELRGQLMQAAVPDGSGGMAAVIGLDDDQIVEFCAAYPGHGVLEPANFNSPGQVVLAGAAGAIDWVMDNAKTHGARMAVRVAMSVPSHCSMMRGAAERLFEGLSEVDIQTPQIPVLHNVDAQPGRGGTQIRDVLRAQLHQPVRWTNTIEAMSGQGIDTFLECGPGKVLCGLNKRIVKSANSIALESPAGFEQCMQLFGRQ